MFSRKKSLLLLIFVIFLIGLCEERSCSLMSLPDEPSTFYKDNENIKIIADSITVEEHFAQENKEEKVQKEYTENNEDQKTSQPSENDQIIESDDELGDRFNLEMEAPQENEEDFIYVDRKQMSDEDSTIEKEKIDVVEDHRFKEVYKENEMDQELNKSFHRFHEDKAYKTYDIADDTKNSPVSPQQGLIGVTVLNNPTLHTSFTYNHENKPILTLQYRGEGLINLNLISSTYIIFQVPQPIAEIMEQEKMRAFYNVPALGLLGIEIRKPGEFHNHEIQIIGDQVVLRFDELLSLNLLNYTYYEFDLHMELPYIPYTPSGQYTFVSQATKQIVNLNLLDDPVASGILEILGVLEFQHVPSTITFETMPIPSLPQYVNRKDDQFSISIRDTRGYDAPWRLDAKLTKPLTLTSNQSETIEDAIKFKIDNYTEVTLTEQAQTIFSGRTKENPITQLTWNREQGPLMYIDPCELKVGDYQTEIIWTLVDAP